MKEVSRIRTKKHNLLKDLTRIHNRFSVKEVEVVAYWCSLFFIFERKMAYWQEHLTHHIKGVIDQYWTHPANQSTAVITTLFFDISH